MKQWVNADFLSICKEGRRGFGYLPHIAPWIADNVYYVQFSTILIEAGLQRSTQAARFRMDVCAGSMAPTANPSHDPLRAALIESSSR